MTQRKVSRGLTGNREDASGTQDNAVIQRRTLLRGATAVAAISAAALVPQMTLAADEGQTVNSSELQGRRGGAPRIEVERGVSLRVEDWGAGKPVLFVHGWPSSHRIFERQLLGLAERGYRAIGIDQRGFGESDKPWHDNDYDTWAHDIDAVITALRLKDITLVGYSMGGAVAVHYLATRRKTPVRKLVLIGAAGPTLVQSEDNPAGLPREVIDAMLAGIRADRQGFFHEFMPGMFHQPVSDAYIRWFEDVVTGASLQATIRGLEEGRDRDLTQEFAGIDIPTLILHGMHDNVVPFQFAEVQHELIEGSQLVAFEESGHAPFVEEAERLTETIAAFAG